jgi:hypothetical protein
MIEIRRARTCQPRFSTALALARGKKQHVHTRARTRKNSVIRI